MSTAGAREAFRDAGVSVRAGRRVVRAGVRGFTLIEMLVVLVITAVMMMLLLPTFSRARDAAQKVQCATRLRTIGLWATEFANKYKYFPRAQHSYNALAANWGPVVTHGVNPATGTKYAYNWQSMIADMLILDNTLVTQGKSTNPYEMAQDMNIFADVSRMPGSRSAAYGQNLYAGGGFDYGSNSGSLTGSATSGQWVKWTDAFTNGVPNPSNPAFGALPTAYKASARNRLLYMDIDNGASTLHDSFSYSIVAGQYTRPWVSAAPGHGGSPQGNSNYTPNSAGTVAYRHMQSPPNPSAGTCTYEGYALSSVSGVANALWTDLHVESYQGTSYYHTANLQPSTCSGSMPLDSSSWAPQFD